MERRRWQRRTDDRFAQFFKEIEDTFVRTFGRDMTPQERRYFYLAESSIRETEFAGEQQPRDDELC